MIWVYKWMFFVDNVRRVWIKDVGGMGVIDGRLGSDVQGMVEARGYKAGALHIVGCGVCRRQGVGCRRIVASTQAVWGD